jgi:hypothetical protein
MGGIPVYLEVGSKKVFACALEWPGWARAGRTEDEALETLSAYVPRYEAVASAAAAKLPAAARRGAFEVVDRLKGNSTTDFGAPGIVPEFDFDGPTPAKWKRQLGLLQGCWAVFDSVVEAAPARLEKGPRGGGRDRDQIVSHVLDAEASYARMAGGPARAVNPADAREVAATRRDLIARLQELHKTGPTAGPRGGKRWPASYAVRRIAWHVLDHAWEIEDKSLS